MIMHIKSENQIKQPKELNEFNIRDKNRYLDLSDPETEHNTELDVPITSDTDEELIQMEITDYDGRHYKKHIYTVPQKFYPNNVKRLICYSILNKEKCQHDRHCTYAHSLAEQVIDQEKKFIYQIILDSNLMDFESINNQKKEYLYKQLLFNTNLCENCQNNKCPGGYNCKHGTNSSTLKLCKNDLLTGQCLNKIITIQCDPSIVAKIDGITKLETYTGCINGHHLSIRELVPYYKFIHQCENSKKNKYQSVRYIDINQVGKIIQNNWSDNDDGDNSDASTDDEINSWFKKDDIDDTL